MYTRVAAGQETDEIEDWLSREFESPAEEALEKATSDARLNPEDWRRLVRFLAAQDLRTPARLLEILRDLHAKLPELLDSTLRDTIQINTAAAKRLVNIAEDKDFSEYLPVRAIVRPEPDGKTASLKLEAIAGRGMWIFALKHLLNRTLDVLHEHRWTILIAPPGLNWFTTDDPVVRLNYRPDHHDFRGTWGSPGSDIILPLSPTHLLYTRIGHKPPPRGEILEQAHCRLIRKIIAEHAHRMIFAASRDEEIPAMRPRVVSDETFREETAHWQKWNGDQVAAEKRLMQPEDEI